jgi:hypothetical protein
MRMGGDLMGNGLEVVEQVASGTDVFKDLASSLPILKIVFGVCQVRLRQYYTGTTKPGKDPHLVFSTHPFCAFPQTTAGCCQGPCPSECEQGEIEPLTAAATSFSKLLTSLLS